MAAFYTMDLSVWTRRIAWLIIDEVMNGNQLQRSGLPLFFLAAFILAAAVGLVIITASPFTGGFFPGASSRTAEPRGEDAPAQSEPAEQAKPAEPAQPAQPAEQAEPADPPPAPEPRTTGTTHRIARRDTLFDLSNRYWGDAYLWPVMYSDNVETLSDPDLLRPGRELTISTRPTATSEIVDAHVLAYQKYRELGDAAVATGREQNSAAWIQRGRIRVNNAHWLLYSGLRYDRDLLDKVRGRVQERDIAVVRRFIELYGPAPGSR